MKKTLLLFTFFFGIWGLQAQEVACVPDSTLADSLIVFPTPLNPETGEGGIEMFPACINEPYELVFNFRLPTTTVYNGFELSLVRAEIETANAVKGLPEGVNYFCNPPNCNFTAGELGCIVLTGTPTANNTPDTNRLVITASITADALGTIVDSIPGNFITGEFNLVVNNTGGCTTVSTTDYLATNVQLANMPNPVFEQTTIEVSSEISGIFQFQVFDIAGKLIHTRNVQLEIGYNNFDYDASNLGEGMYIYTLRNELGAVSQKMIVGKR